MSEVLYRILALIVGLALGALFFGSLWFIVRKAMNAKMPALWFFCGFIFRMAVTLIGFYYISQGSWQRLLICLLGFVGARIIIMRLTKATERKSMPIKMDINHET